MTERPEAALAGRARIIGTSREAIVAEAADLLNNSIAYRVMSEGENPYGDGHAARRILEALVRWFQGRNPILEAGQEFQGTVSTSEEVAISD